MYIPGFLILPAAVLAQRAAVPDFERLQDGVRLRTADGILSVHVKSDSIVRVTFAKSADFRADDMVVVSPPNAATTWTTSSTAQTVTVSTPRLRVTASRSDGAVTFAD